MRIKISDAVRERIHTLQNEHGQLTPAVVVADAKNPESPLHRMFDWNVESAAEKHWLNTARRIIVSVKVVITTETVTFKAPMMVRDPSVPPKEQGYVSLVALQKDATAARASVLSEFGRAESALTRARNLASVLNLSDEIEALILRLTGLRTVVEGDTASQQQRAS